jgi:hypothetical protein
VISDPIPYLLLAWKVWRKNKSINSNI